MDDGRSSEDPDRSRPAETVAVSELDDPDRSPRGRRGRVVAGLVALLCVVGMAVAVAATGGDRGGDDRADDPIVKTPSPPKTPAALEVFAALGTTTASGSFNATYEFHSTPGSGSDDNAPSSCGDIRKHTAPDGSVSESQTCVAIGAYSSSPVTITGRSTINIDPYRMISVSDVTGFGEITVRVDGTRLWETGGGNYGMTGRPGADTAGAPISGFADLVAGTLGPGPGALTMLTIASPNGYLNLQKEAVSGVTPAGAGVVDGVPVTYFEVVIDPARLLTISGLTDEQVKTIREALAQLKAAGYRSTTTKVGIDAAGLIRETTSVADFEDGSRQTSHTVLSNFGCAGFVRLPGDPPSSAVAAPCASTTPTTPTTTVAPTSTTTMPPSPDTSTSVPQGSMSPSTSVSTTASTQP